MTIDKIVQSEISESRLIEFAKTIELEATRFLDGQHHSPRAGQGVEYHSSVPYSEGEDAKHIDWKRFARADRYYVNRYEREEKTSWALAIDRTGSMKYGLKRNFAEQFVGILGFLAKVWSDPCAYYPEGRIPFDESVQALSKHQLGFENLREFSRELGSLKEDRLVIVSDFFWEDEDLNAVIEAAHDSFAQTYLVQVLDLRELHFDFKEPMIEFQDLESPEKLILSAANVRKQYLQLLEDLWKKMDRYKSDSVERFLFTSEENQMGKCLQAFFDRLLGVQQ